MADAQHSGLTRTAAMLVAAATLAGGLSASTAVADTTPTTPGTGTPTTTQEQKTPRQQLQDVYDAGQKLVDAQTQFAKDHGKHLLYAQTGIDNLSKELTAAKTLLDDEKTEDKALTAAADTLTKATTLEKTVFGKLADLITEQSARTDTSKYEGDLDGLKTAITNATGVLNDETKTDQDATTQLTALQQAGTAVIEKDLTGLRDALKAADAVKANGRVYTTDTQKTFDDAYTTASQLPADAPDATRKDAADKLTKAINGLQAQAVVDLQKAIDEAGKIDASKYTDATSTPFTKALQDAKTIKGDTKESDAQRTNARTTLEAAQKNLVAKTFDALNQSITAAQKKLASSQHWTADSKQATETALDTAKKTLGDKNDVTVDAQRATVQQKLDTAVSKLITKEHQRLGQALTEANQYTDGSLFTDSTWADLQKATTAGAKLYAQDDQDETVYGMAADNVEQATGALTTKTFEALTQSVAAAKAAINDGRTYTDATLKPAQDALGKAEASLQGSKSDTTVDDERTQLKTVLDNAVSQLITVNQQALNDAIAKADAMSKDAGSYTGDTWNQVTTAVNAGRTIQQDPNASEQARKQAADGINTAIANLITRQWDALNTSINNATARVNDTKNGQWTKSTLDAANNALKDAQTALQGDKVDLTLDQTRQQAADKLDKTVAALETEGHAQLAAKISEAQAKIDLQAKKDGKAYTADTFKQLNDKVNLAKAANDTTVPDSIRFDYVQQIDTALRSLLVESWTVDKTTLTRTDNGFTGSLDLDPADQTPLKATGSDDSTISLAPVADSTTVNANGDLQRAYTLVDNGHEFTVTITDTDWQWHVTLNDQATPLTYKDGWYEYTADKPLNDQTPVDKVTLGNGDVQTLDDPRSLVTGTATDAGQLGLIAVNGTATYELTAPAQYAQLGIKGFRVNIPANYQVGGKIGYTEQQDTPDAKDFTRGENGTYTANVETTLDDKDQPSQVNVTLTDQAKTPVTVQLGDKTQTAPDRDGNTFAIRSGETSKHLTVTDPLSGETVTQTYTVTANARRAWNDSITGLTLIEHDPTVKEPTTLPFDQFDPNVHDYTIERPNTAVKDSYTLGWKTGVDATLTNVQVSVNGISRILTVTLNQGRANEATYTVTVNFADAEIQPDSPAKLQGIQWNAQGDPNGTMQNVPDWDPNRLDYTLTVGENDPSPYVIPKYDANTVDVEPGKVTQTADSVRQEWKVTDKGTGATRTYSVTVVRAHSWKTAVEEFKPSDPVAQKPTVTPDNDSDANLVSHGYVTPDGTYVPVNQDNYQIPEGGTFSYEAKLGQSAGVVSQRVKGMTYQYTVTVLPQNMGYPTQHTFTVTYLTAKTHAAALTGIKVNGQDIQGFTPDKYEYEVPVPDPQQWMVSPQYDKLTGQTVDTDKQGDTARITVTSGDGLTTVTYTVHATKQTTLAQTGMALGIIALIAAGLAAIGATLTYLTRRMRKHDDDANTGEIPKITAAGETGTHGEGMTGQQIG